MNMALQTGLSLVVMLLVYGAACWLFNVRYSRRIDRVGTAISLILILAGLIQWIWQ